MEFCNEIASLGTDLKTSGSTLVHVLQCKKAKIIKLKTSAQHYFLKKLSLGICNIEHLHKKTLLLLVKLLLKEKKNKDENNMTSTFQAALIGTSSAGYEQNFFFFLSFIKDFAPID